MHLCRRLVKALAGIKVGLEQLGIVRAPPARGEAGQALVWSFIGGPYCALELAPRTARPPELCLLEPTGTVHSRVRTAPARHRVLPYLARATNICDTCYNLVPRCVAVQPFSRTGRQIAPTQSHHALRRAKHACGCALAPLLCIGTQPPSIHPQTCFSRNPTILCTSVLGQR